MFQFQYDTSEAAIEDYEITTNTDVSIPVWYKWSYFYRSWKRRFYEFQFQYDTSEAFFLLTSKKYVTSFNSSMIQVKQGTW